MEEQSFTIEDVINDAVDTIKGIMLPVEYGDTSAQLLRLLKNFRAVQNWMIEQKEKQKVKEEIENEPTEVSDGREADAE